MARTNAMDIIVKAADQWASLLEENARKGTPDESTTEWAKEIRASIHALAESTAEVKSESSEGTVSLTLNATGCDVLDRALTGFAKALQAAWDMAVITHETFCDEADKARALQYQLWEAKDKASIS